MDEVSLAMEWKKKQLLLSAQKQLKRRNSISGQSSLGGLTHATVPGEVRLSATSLYDESAIL